MCVPGHQCALELFSPISSCLSSMVTVAFTQYRYRRPSAVVLARDDFQLEKVVFDNAQNGAMFGFDGDLQLVCFDQKRRVKVNIHDDSIRHRLGGCDSTVVRFRAERRRALVLAIVPHGQVTITFNDIALLALRRPFIFRKIVGAKVELFSDAGKVKDQFRLRLLKGPVEKTSNAAAAASSILLHI